jgi:uncharacterized protein (DUF2344 family)
MTNEKNYLPLALVLGCIVIAGSYFAVETNKQKSIERQQEIKIEETRRQEEQKTKDAENKAAGERLRESFDAGIRKRCASEAEQSAVEMFKTICDNDGGTLQCQEGRYLKANYESAYETCLQKNGLSN